MPIYQVEAPDGKILEIEGPEGASPDQVTSFAIANYYASQQKPEEPAPVAAPEPEQGDFMRGLKSYFPSIKETFGGAQVLAGKALGSEELVRGGVERVRGAQAEQKGKKTDDLTEAWDQGIGSVLTDWLPYQIGSGVGNIAESVAMAGVGSLFGGAVGGAGGIFAKSLVKKGIKEAAKDIIEDQIAKGATKEAAKEAGAKYVAEMGAKELEESAAKYLAKQGGKAYGATAGIGAQALLHGMGETTSRALQEAGMNPENMDLGTLLPAAGIHTVADFVSEKILLGGLRGMNLGGLSEKSTGKLVYDVLKGAAKTGAKEIIPEDIQSAAERYGAKLPVASADAISEYINTAGAAFAMSVLPGGVGGVRTYAGRQITPPPQGVPPTSPGVEPTAEPGVEPTGVPPAGEAADEGARIREMEEERARQAGILQPEPVTPESTAAPQAAETVAPTDQEAAPQVAPPQVQQASPEAQRAIFGNAQVMGVLQNAAEGLTIGQSEYDESGSKAGINRVKKYLMQYFSPILGQEKAADYSRYLVDEGGLNEADYGSNHGLFGEAVAGLQIPEVTIQPPANAEVAPSEPAIPTAPAVEEVVAPEAITQPESIAPTEEHPVAHAEVHPLENPQATREQKNQAIEQAGRAGISLVSRGNKIDLADSTFEWDRLSKMKTAGQALKQMRDHVPMDYRAIIDRIMPAVKDIPVSINRRVTKGWGGQHSANVVTGDQQIQYARKVYYGNTLETVLHEVIHGATVVNYMRGARGLDPKYKNAAKELDDLAQFIRDNTTSQQMPFLHSPSYTKKQWGVELIARAMTERDVQEALKNLKMPNQKTAWSKFVELVCKFLDIKPGEQNAMSRLLEISEKFMEPVEKHAGRGKPFAIPSAQEEVVTTPSVSPHKAYTGGPAPQPSFGIKSFSDMTTFERVMDNLVYKYLDKHKDMRDVIKAIADAGRKMSATWDAYMRETLYHNRVAYMAKQFLNNEVKPLAQDMVKYGITEEELHNYLLARHAIEYNAEMNARNDSPYIQNRGSGVHSLIAGLYMGQIPASEKSVVLSKVGELNENEKALIKDMESMSSQKMKNLQAMAKKVDAITARTQDITVAGGLEAPETIQYWRDKYPHYVPLKRDPEELDFVSTNLGMGQGFSTRAGVGKAAVGSTKTVDNILSNIMLQRDIAITRAEKARIGRALYGMFLQNPNPGFVLPVNPSVGIVSKVNEMAAKLAAARAKLSEMNADPSADPQVIQAMRDKLDAQQAEYNRLKPQADAAQAAMIQELIDSGMVPEGVDPVAFAENMIKEPEGAFYNEKTGKVEYRTNAYLRGSKNVLAIPINGETRYLFFNPSDERAMRMINALKNNDLEKIGEFTQMVAKATRWISAVNTQYNPFFGILNMLRDVQGAQFNLSTTALKGEQLAVNKHIVPSLFAIYRSLRAERAGTETDNQYAKEWHEFQKLGGPTGYKDMIGRERDQLSVLAEEIKKLNEGEAKATSRKAFDAIVGRMSDFNDSMENAVRLSAFIEAKKKFASQGMSATEAADKAAELAKNLTVNFNRKGQKTALVNSWYAFFNAAAQGSARLIETVRGPAGKKIMASLVLLGVMQSLLLQAAGFGDDDPPEFVREKNFVIPAGDGKYLSWPLPLGFNVFTNFGRLSADIVNDILNNNGRHASDKAVAMASTLSNTFNPFGSSGLSIQTLAPTVADPLAAIAENRDAFGRPIHRADMATKPTPGYLRSREGTSDIANFFAAALNRMSGGTEFQKGAISPTGDDIEYLAGQVGGGTWREGRKLFGLATKGEGEEIPPYKIPLYGRFVGDTGAKANISNQFYQNVTQLASYGQEIEGRAKNKQDFQEFLQDHPEARMYKASANVYNKISDLNHMKKLMIEHNAPKDQIKQVEDAKINIMKAFNEQVRAAQQ